MALLGTPYVVVCPFFFTQPAIPPARGSGSGCLSVDARRNRFVENGMGLVGFQVWELVHELVHFYVYASRGVAYDFYGVNACLAMLGRGAVGNAPSYVFYVASMLCVCVCL